MSGDCAACNHSAAYHDGDGGRPCRAWAPNDAATTDVCPCKGWKQPKPAPTTPAPEPDTFDWTS